MLAAARWLRYDGDHSHNGTHEEHLNEGEPEESPNAEPDQRARTGSHGERAINHGKGGYQERSREWTKETISSRCSKMHSCRQNRQPKLYLCGGAVN